jgi:uncharacterized protein
VKIVLDTNVLISGIFFSGPPYQILSPWRDGIIQIATSVEILDEYERVAKILARDHPNININSFIYLLINNSIIINAPPFSEKVCDDPDDDKFLACAIFSNSPIIVSGEKHLLKLDGFKGIEIINPRGFVDKYLT